MIYHTKMKTPRTQQESKTTPREGVAIVEAAFAEKLESELHEMSITLALITERGGIGDEGMYDDARALLSRHNELRALAKS